MTSVPRPFDSSTGNPPATKPDNPSGLGFQNSPTLPNFGTPPLPRSFQETSTSGVPRGEFINPGDLVSNNCGGANGDAEGRDDLKQVCGTRETGPDRPIVPVFGNRDKEFPLPDLYVMFRDLKISRSAWNDDKFLDSLGNTIRNSYPPTTLPVDQYGQYIVDDGCTFCDNLWRLQPSHFQEAQWWDYSGDNGTKSPIPYPDSGPGYLSSTPPTCRCALNNSAKKSTFPGPCIQAPTGRREYDYDGNPVAEDEAGPCVTPSHALEGAGQPTIRLSESSQPKNLRIKLRCRPSGCRAPAKPQLLPQPTPGQKEQPEDIKPEEDLSPEARRRKMRTERQRLKRKALRDLKIEAAATAAAEVVAAKPPKRARTSNAALESEEKTPEPKLGPRRRPAARLRPKKLTAATATTTRQGTKRSPTLKIGTPENAGAEARVARRPSAKRTRAVQEEAEQALPACPPTAPAAGPVTRAGAVTRALASSLKQGPSQPPSA